MTYTVQTDYHTIDFTDKIAHKLVLEKFGNEALKNLTDMAHIKLRRAILEKDS